MPQTVSFLRDFPDAMGFISWSNETIQSKPVLGQTLYTGVLRINVAGYKKKITKFITKFANHPEHILPRSIRNSALQIEERTVNFANGTIFKELVLTQISNESRKF